MAQGTILFSGGLGGRTPSFLLLAWHDGGRGKKAVLFFQQGGVRSGSDNSRGIAPEALEARCIPKSNLEGGLTLAAAV